MTSEPTGDRLAQIKRRLPTQEYITLDDAAWLIAEIERMDNFAAMALYEKNIALAEVRLLRVENGALRTKAEGDLVSRLRDGILAAENDNARLRVAAGILQKLARSSALYALAGVGGPLEHLTDAEIAYLAVAVTDGDEERK